MARRRHLAADRRRPAQEARSAEGRDPTPRVGYVDSQTVETTEVGGERGYDGGKKTGGRKRRAAFDSLGLLMAVSVTAASADDGATAPRVLGRLDRARSPRLEAVRGDAKSRNHALDAWSDLEREPLAARVVGRPAGSEGFVKLPRRWVAERSFAWLGRDRRHGKDYEYYPASSEAWARVSAIGQMLGRLAPDEGRRSAPFMYGKKAAAWRPVTPELTDVV